MTLRLFLLTCVLYSILPNLALAHQYDNMLKDCSLSSAREQYAKYTNAKKSMEINSKHNRAAAIRSVFKAIKILTDTTKEIDFSPAKIERFTGDKPFIFSSTQYVQPSYIVFHPNGRFTRTTRVMLEMVTDETGSWKQLPNGTIKMTSNGPVIRASGPSHAFRLTRRISRRETLQLLGKLYKLFRYTSNDNFKILFINEFFTIEADNVCVKFSSSDNLLHKSHLVVFRDYLLNLLRVSERHEYFFVPLIYKKNCFLHSPTNGLSLDHLDVCKRLENEACENLKEFNYFQISDEQFHAAQTRPFKFDFDKVINNQSRRLKSNR